MEYDGPKQFSFVQSGGSQNLNIRVWSSWKATSDASWLVLSPSSGDAGADGATAIINMIAAPNDGYDDRNCRVSVVSAGKEIIVEVSQTRKSAVLLDENEMTFSFREQMSRVGLKSNEDVTATVDHRCSDWLSVNSTKSLIGMTFDVCAAENASGEPRLGKIYFSTTVGVADTLTVNQDRGPAILSYDVPGLYNAEGAVIVSERFISQYGLMILPDGCPEYHIINPLDRKWCLIKGKKPYEASSEEKYSVNVRQNILLNLSGSFDVELDVCRYKDGKIWGEDEVAGYGIIMEVE